MIPAPLHLAGERLLLDPTGGLFWPAARTLIVADLHFEKGSAAAAGGRLLPPWDTRTTLDRLGHLIHRYAPERVVALGDSFHDVRGPTRLAPSDAARLRLMTEATPFLWILGNHDPRPPDGIGGQSVAVWQHGPITFRHQAEPGGGVEVCGHHHPKAQVAVRGTTVTRPCFVGDARRLMLPAMGAYAGGLDVRSPAIARLFPRGGRAFLLGRDRLFSFPLQTLSATPA